MVEADLSIGMRLLWLGFSCCDLEKQTCQLGVESG